MTALDGIRSRQAFLIYYRHPIAQTPLRYSISTEFRNVGLDPLQGSHNVQTFPEYKRDIFSGDALRDT